MNTKGADPFKSLLELTPTQVTALEVLESGGTRAEAATAAGVHRVTVSKWCHHHPAFIAERNRRQIERTERLAVVADAVTIRALDVVISAIDGGDTGVAIQWLRIVGSHPIVAHEINSLNERPVTAGGVIDGVAEDKSIVAPLAALNGAYRESAINSIASDLVE